MAALVRRLAMLAGGCVAVPFAVIAQDLSHGTGSGPRLVLSETEHELARPDPRANPSPFQVTIRNSGDQPLEIRKVRTSCPCLSVNLSEVTVASGGETSLRLEVSPQGVEAFLLEEVLIYSNDPSRPMSKIRVFGDVGTAIRTIPEGIPFDVVYRGDVADKEFPPVRLIATDRASLGRIRIIPSHPSIRPEARKLDDTSYEIGIAIDKTVPLGQFKESLRVETEHPVTPVIDIPIGGVIVGELDSAGRRVDFGFIKEGQPASARLTLRKHGNRDIKILSAVAKLPVPAEARVTPDGNDFRLVVSIASAPAFTRLVGEVEIHTDNTDEPLVRLPVSGGVLAMQPFERAAADAGDNRFLTIVKDVLARGERIPADRFFSDVLGDVKDKRAIALLLRALAEGDVPTRMRAVELLAEFKTPEVVERLRNVVTDDPHEFVRRRAVAAYVEGIGKAAVPVVLMALQDDAEWVREEAATYLGKLGDASAIPALRDALIDPDPDAATAIREALVALQPRAK